MGYELPFIGLLVSLVFTGITGFYPGGIIVPSYLVLFMDQPARIAGTLIAAFMALVSYKLASHYLILFGRRRFVFIVLIGGIWALLWRELFPSIFPLSLEFRVIGWVIPGLIASHLERQGVVVTTASLVTVTVAIFFLGRILNML
ncbi:MAG: poly-gamma-glutamate biosynthesis protein PgsC [Candidatus Latescibacteria bacterium]|jgi:poly-gamma-glutamate biosynthesis protein PgsC/CapC|nr:poly-gamma-glutamate biosynthesis protein PgsC [Candidatus Latescibacterota bacterium]